MPKLVKNNVFVEHDKWCLLHDHIETPKIPKSGLVGLPQALYLELAHTLPEDEMARFGIIITGDADLNQIKNYINKTPLIAIHFPLFMDGRGFSTGRILREQFDFNGELRAVGNIMMQDQLYYLSRCGFNAFEIDDNADEDSVLKSLKAFSENYQAGVDNPQPLFRRRA